MVFIEQDVFSIIYTYLQSAIQYIHRTEQKLQRVEARVTPPLAVRPRTRLQRWLPEWGRDWHRLWRIMQGMCAC